jgi:hypothetical protein
MNILIVDAQGILSQKQTAYAENRLRFSLARFDHRVNGATMHFSIDDACENVACTVNVNVEEVGIVSVSKRSFSSQEVLNLAVDAIEPKVAFRIDWKMWFNADTFATWVLTASEPLKRFFGFRRPQTARRSRGAADNRRALSVG